MASGSPDYTRIITEDDLGDDQVRERHFDDDVVSTRAIAPGAVTPTGTTNIATSAELDAQGVLLQDNIDDEETARIAADDGLQDSLNTHVAAATGVHGVGASTVESAAGAQAKADAVQSNLDTEQTARIAADDGLQDAINDHAALPGTSVHGLGSMSTRTQGTAGSHHRTNSQMDGRYVQQANVAAGKHTVSQSTRTLNTGLSSISGVSLTPDLEAASAVIPRIVSIIGGTVEYELRYAGNPSNIASGSVDVWWVAYQ